MTFLHGCSASSQFSHGERLHTHVCCDGGAEESTAVGAQTTVHEALIYSAFLRLPGAVNRQVKEDFVDEIMAVVELTPLRNAIVGLPGEFSGAVYGGAVELGLGFC